MDIHFNAFISYRHHPEDIKVAMQVHRALERYHIPRGLKKKLNVQGPMRLFRDKEELPITSNLNDDIGDALRNSDYLIVICSVHTKESIWVQREIELFLQSHPRHRVLTVLASGEPYDVIPEILLYEDKVDPVTGQTVRELVEPLSCDWRMGLKKAKREELPRLAAPLLGCAYDELRQRQKQYRMRRLVTLISLALAASLGFSVYVLRNSMIIQEKNEEIQAQNVEIQEQNVQIQANLESAQRNQSRHLATAAQERLAEGDRLTAIALASAALPAEDNVRPYVPEAEFALTEALGIYQQNIKTVAAGTVSPGSQTTVTDFYISHSGKVLFLKDDRACITTWDTETLEEIGTWDLRQETLSDMLILPDDNALLRVSAESGMVLRCMTPAGDILWEMEDCYDMAVTDDDTTVLVLCPNGLWDSMIRFLDVKTGRELREPLLLETMESGLTPSKFFLQHIPSDYPIPIRYSDFSAQELYLYDRQTGNYRGMALPTYYPDQTMVTEDGKLVLTTFAQSDSLTGAFEGTRVNAPMRRLVYCYDIQTGTELWQTQIDSSMAGSGSLNVIPDSNLLLCQSGPVFQVIDAATGETVNRCEAGSRVVCVTMGEKYAQAVLEDGYICNYWYYENYCYEEKNLQSGLEKAEICTNYYTLQRESNHVTVYRREEPPVAWQYQHSTAVTIRDQRQQGAQWAIADSNKLFLVDMQEQTLRWSLELEGVQLLDFSRDGSKLWVAAGSNGRKLLAIDTATGKYTGKALAGEQYSNESYLARNGVLFYTQETEEQLLLLRLDLETGKTDSFPVPVDVQSLYSSRVAGQWGPYAWIWCNNGSFVEMNMQTGSGRILAEEVETCPSVAVKEDGSLVAATNANRILMMTPGADDLRNILLDNSKAGSVYYWGNELLALCDDGYLYRYDLAGILLSRTELTVGASFNRLLSDEANRSVVSWQKTNDGKLVVNAYKVGNVIDCENWTVSTVVPGYRLYYGAEDQFVGYNESGFAGYSHYSVEELLELAGEELVNFQLTEDQKLSYGIQ